MTPTVREARPTSTGLEDEQVIRQASGDDAIASPTGASPRQIPSATPTARPPTATVAPTPTIGLDDVVLPTVPRQFRVGSCEDAADLFIERIQLLLDGLALLPEEALVDGDDMPAAWVEFFDEIETQIDHIGDAAQLIGCTDEDLQALIFPRFDRLMANGPLAEAFLTAFLEEMESAIATPTPTPIVEPTAAPNSTATPYERGLQIVEPLCGICHTVAGTQAQGAVGPELTNFANQELIAGVLPNNAENLRLWLANPPAVKPGTAMPNLGLTEQEIEALVVYLYSLDGSASP